MTLQQSKKQSLMAGGAVLTVSNADFFFFLYRFRLLVLDTRWF